MSPSLILRACRAFFVCGGALALTVGTPLLARADTACALTDLSCTTGTIVGSSTPTLPPNPAGDTIDQVQDQAKDATETVQDTVGDVVDGLLGSGGHDPGGGGGGHHGSGNGNGRGDHGHGGSRSHAGTGQTPGTLPTTAGTVPPIQGPPIDRPVDPGFGGRPTLAQTVTGIALGVIAPLLVLLLCAFGFVTFQQRLDGRDPHLAEAPNVPDVAVFG